MMKTSSTLAVSVPINLSVKLGFVSVQGNLLCDVLRIQCGRGISAIIVTDDYLCYKEPKTPYNFFLILIFNNLFKFKT